MSADGSNYLSPYSVNFYVSHISWTHAKNICEMLLKCSQVRTKQWCVIEFLHTQKFTLIDIHWYSLDVYSNWRLHSGVDNAFWQWRQLRACVMNLIPAVISPRNTRHYLRSDLFTPWKYAMLVTVTPWKQFLSGYVTVLLAFVLVSVDISWRHYFWGVSAAEEKKLYTAFFSLLPLNQEKMCNFCWIMVQNCLSTLAGISNDKIKDSGHE